jgi:uncharacterized protein YecT (DUF1311 family)
MKILCAMVVFALGIGTPTMFGQESKKPVHAWDVMMDQPEAKAAAKALIGHCGDAQTQDVMNACYALMFENADQQMNSVYRATMKELDADGRQHVRAAQLAWLRYRDRHCEAVGDIRVGVGSLEPTEVFGCKADLAEARKNRFRAITRANPRLFSEPTPLPSCSLQCSYL